MGVTLQGGGHAPLRLATFGAALRRDLVSHDLRPAHFHPELFTMR